MNPLASLFPGGVSDTPPTQSGNPTTPGSQGPGLYQGPYGPVWGYGPGTTTQSPYGPVTGIPNQPPSNFTPSVPVQGANLMQQLTGTGAFNLYDILVWIFLFIMLIVGIGALITGRSPVQVVGDASKTAALA